MLEILIKGGILDAVMIAESILAWAVVFDRAKAFRENSKVDVRSLRAKVIRLLRQDDLDGACKLCANTPGPVSSVLLAGIRAYGRHRAIASSPEALRALVSDALEDSTYIAIKAVESRLNVLSFVGNSAPLFGMTGTVTGMIKSFEAMGAAGALEGAAVAAGVAEALITTAVGLIVAMAAVIPFHYFTSLSGKVESQIHEAGVELLDFITLHMADKSAK
ncbi:MAG: MotA/TolQ/ExbB proton channel family protein [Kiritimatiellia bacterium]|jgi:biopolymer transport protein ExbB